MKISYNIKKITWPLGDTDLIFLCWYNQHSKIKSISPHSHVIPLCIWRKCVFLPNKYILSLQFFKTVSIYSTLLNDSSNRWSSVRLVLKSYKKHYFLNCHVIKPNMTFNHVALATWNVFYAENKNVKEGSSNPRKSNSKNVNKKK